MDPVQQYAALLIEHAKIKAREIKKMWNRENRAKALPKVPGVYIPNNYINPVTLEPPPKGVIVYKVTNRTTKRTNYYNAHTFWRLAGHQRNNYKLLMFDPKKNIFTTPYTRGGVRARNVQRVRVKGTKSNAATKIQRVYRRAKKA
jgi:hypothetical protein